MNSLNNKRQNNPQGTSKPQYRRQAGLQLPSFDTKAEPSSPIRPERSPSIQSTTAPVPCPSEKQLGKLLGVLRLAPCNLVRQVGVVLMVMVCAIEAKVARVDKTKKTGNKIVRLQSLPSGNDLERRLPGWAVKRRRNLGRLRDLLCSSYGTMEPSDARIVYKYVNKISAAADVARAYPEAGAVFVYVRASLNNALGQHEMKTLSAAAAGIVDTDSSRMGTVALEGKRCRVAESVQSVGAQSKHPVPGAFSPNVGHISVLGAATVGGRCELHTVDYISGNPGNIHPCNSPGANEDLINHSRDGAEVIVEPFARESNVSCGPTATAPRNVALQMAGCIKNDTINEVYTVNSSGNIRRGAIERRVVRTTVPFYLERRHRNILLLIVSFLPDVEDVRIPRAVVTSREYGIQRVDRVVHNSTESSDDATINNGGGSRVEAIYTYRRPIMAVRGNAEIHRGADCMADSSTPGSLIFDNSNSTNSTQSTGEPVTREEDAVSWGNGPIITDVDCVSASCGDGTAIPRVEGNNISNARAARSRAGSMSESDSSAYVPVVSQCDERAAVSQLGKEEETRMVAISTTTTTTTTTTTRSERIVEEVVYSNSYHDHKEAVTWEGSGSILPRRTVSPGITRYRQNDLPTATDARALIGDDGSRGSSVSQNDDSAAMSRYSSSTNGSVAVSVYGPYTDEEMACGVEDWALPFRRHGRGGGANASDETSVGAFCREADDVGDVGGVENTRQDEDSPVANTIPNLGLSLATLSVSHSGRPAPGVSSALAAFTARTTAEYDALANISDAGSAHQPVLINNEPEMPATEAAAVECNALANISDAGSVHQPVAPNNTDFNRCFDVNDHDDEIELFHSMQSLREGSIAGGDRLSASSYSNTAGVGSGAPPYQVGSCRSGRGGGIDGRPRLSWGSSVSNDRRSGFGGFNLIDDDEMSDTEGDTADSGGGRGEGYMPGLLEFRRQLQRERELEEQGEEAKEDKGDGYAAARSPLRSPTFNRRSRSPRSPASCEMRVNTRSGSLSRRRSSGGSGGSDRATAAARSSGRDSPPPSPRPRLSSAAHAPEIQQVQHHSLLSPMPSRPLTSHPVDLSNSTANAPNAAAADQAQRHSSSSPLPSGLSTGRFTGLGDNNTFGIPGVGEASGGAMRTFESSLGGRRAGDAGGGGGGGGRGGTWMKGLKTRFISWLSPTPSDGYRYAKLPQVGPLGLDDWPEGCDEGCDEGTRHSGCVRRVTERPSVATYAMDRQGADSQPTEEAQGSRSTSIEGRG